MRSHGRRVQSNDQFTDVSWSSFLWKMSWPCPFLHCVHFGLSADKKAPSSLRRRYAVSEKEWFCTYWPAGGAHRLNEVWTVINESCDVCHVTSPTIMNGPLIYWTTLRHRVEPTPLRPPELWPVEECLCGDPWRWMMLRWWWPQRTETAEG